MVVCLERGADCLHYGPINNSTFRKLPSSLASLKLKKLFPLIKNLYHFCIFYLVSSIFAML